MMYTTLQYIDAENYTDILHIEEDFAESIVRDDTSKLLVKELGPF